MSYSNRMTMNPIGWGSTALFLIGLFVYAASGEVIDLGWLFLSILISLAVAAIVSHIFFTTSGGNDELANYTVAVTLLACGLVSIILSPGDDDYTDPGPTNTNTQAQGGYVSPDINRQPGANNEQLRQAQQAFVGEELSENLRITEALNRVLLDSQRMHSGTTKEDLDRMLQRVISQEDLLTELEEMINTQNERFRRKLLDAGANTDQANELAIAFATSQRENFTENNRRLEAWRRIYELTKQSLTLLRDHYGDWRYDDQRGAVVFRNEQVMKRFGPIQDEMQALIDANR